MAIVTTEKANKTSKTAYIELCCLTSIERIP